MRLQIPGSSTLPMPEPTTCCLELVVLPLVPLEL